MRITYDPFDKSAAEIEAEDAALAQMVAEAQARGDLDSASLEVTLALHRRLGEYWRWSKERR
jgi:hypothetical protein